MSGLTESSDRRAEEAWPVAETEQERLNRNWQELLAGLRVALPGVQVLLAFLLVVAFQAGFERATSFERIVYMISLLAAAVASILLIAAPIRHRLLFQRAEKPYLVRTGNRITIAGFAFLGLAIVGAILFVTHFLYGTAPSIAASGALCLVIAWAWILDPIARIRRR